VSARQLIEAATKAGLSLAVDGPDLVVEAEGHIQESLLAELRRHKPEILAALKPKNEAQPDAQAPFSELYATEADLQPAPPATVSTAPAPWPEPGLKKEPPFGADKVPSRYEAGWRQLLATCPSWATEYQWAAAIFGCRDLFGEWGAELVRLNWQPDDIFGRWQGIAWYLKGSAVTAIGPHHAFLQDGRIFERRRK
jgi:hypothetical protein